MSLYILMLQGWHRGLPRSRGPWPRDNATSQCPLFWPPMLWTSAKAMSGVQLDALKNFEFFRILEMIGVIHVFRFAQQLCLKLFLG